MTQIGSFARGADGSYTGTIKTLAINVKARLIPSDPATTSEKAPDLRVVVSGVEIGAAWRRTSKDDRVYAHRQAAMLCIHDFQRNGASLRDIAGELLDPLPDDWRLSSERSDLRRLADAAAEMVLGGYRRLLGARPKA